MPQREMLGDTRERMLREIGEALEAIASASPVLVVFEDLHRVDDRSMVDLIAALARRRGPVKMTILGHVRPANTESSGDPLKALAQDLYVASEICAVTYRDVEPAPAPGQVLNKDRTLRTTPFDSSSTPCKRKLSISKELQF